MSTPKNKKISTADFDYYLPAKLIAQQPAKPRDHARLLVFHKKTNRLEHKYFTDISQYLRPGDVIVLNNSKVISARLLGRKSTGGRIEVFLLTKQKSTNKQKKHLQANIWQCLIGGKIRPNQEIILKKSSTGRNNTISATVLKKIDKKTWLVSFNSDDKKLFSLGKTPLPPYIKSKAKNNLLAKQYQTVYASAAGSVAAPTAGLHFTRRLIKKLKNKGIKIEYITLHVGLGTFAPVKSEYIQDHKMHAEFATITKQAAKRLSQAKKNGRRIIAVGTTTVRTLESFCDSADSTLKAKSDWVDIFIYPGYKFKFIDGMITNFHLPKSTLLMLVAAFIEEDINLSTTMAKNKGALLIKSVYAEAIKKNYRFYSFGDAMLIISINH